MIELNVIFLIFWKFFRFGKLLLFKYKMYFFFCLIEWLCCELNILMGVFFFLKRLGVCVCVFVKFFSNIGGLFEVKIYSL